MGVLTGFPKPGELPGELAGILGLPWGPRLETLKTTDPEPGYFAPDSVTWKVMREPFMVLGALRALLMQSANPLISEGALKTRVFERAPYLRFKHTSQWVGTVVFGTKAEADALSAMVMRQHRHINGQLPAEHATDRAGAAAGDPFAATNPQLDRWVHASLIDTLLVTYETLVGPLSVAEQDQFVREWNVVGVMMGMRPADGFATRRELSDYIAREIATGQAHPGEGSREVARQILHPFHIPGARVQVGDALWRTMALLSIGLLPEALRKDFNIPWSPLDAQALRSIKGLSRGAKAMTPPTMRESATYKWASARTRGELAAPGVGVA